MSGKLKAAICLFLNILLISLWIVPVSANDLERKWRAMRTETNALADHARAGDRDALQKLKDLQEQGAGPAIHNLGWLHEVGSDALGWTANETRACHYYNEAAKTGYPPALYTSGLCLYSGAHYVDGDEELRRTALALLERAAKNGWSEAAIVLAKHYLEHIPQGEQAWRAYERKRSEEKDFDAIQADRVIRMGLTSHASKSQKTLLRYYKGVLASKISSATGVVSFREGDAALRQAIDHGHKDATFALEKLRILWFWDMRVAANQKRGIPTFLWQGSYQSAGSIEADCFKPDIAPSRQEKCLAFKSAEISWLRRWRGDIAYARVYFRQGPGATDDPNGSQATDGELKELAQKFDAKIYAFSERWRQHFVVR